MIIWWTSAGRSRLGQHQVAHLDIVAEAFGDAPEADAGDPRGRIAEQRQAGLALADLGQRRGNRARHRLASGDGGLQGRRAGAGDIDQFGVDQQRRSGKDNDGDLRQVDRQRYDDVVRRRRAFGQHLGKGATDLRRRIVEQDGERRLDGVADLGIDIGFEVETTQGTGSGSALAGGGAVDPVKEFAGEHGDQSPILDHLVPKVIKASFTMIRANSRGFP